jgi:tRNA A-37 threonylcarbamoyl transferase component Bud32
MSGTAAILSTSEFERMASAPQDGYITLARRGIFWTIRDNLANLLLPAVEGLVDGQAAGQGLETIKSGPHRTVYRLTVAGRRYYVKHFRIADTRALLQNLIRPSKAEIEWRAAQTIAQLGLPTFEGVALGRLYRGGIVRDSFLISREIPDTVPLDQLVAGELGPAYGANVTQEITRRQSKLRQRLTVGLGELAARLHAAGVVHADFHAANVLVRVSPDGEIGLWLIDLHKMKFRRALSARSRSENLTLLHQFFAGKSSRADRMRFYRAYRHELQNCRGKLQNQGLPEVRDEIAKLEKALVAAAHRGWMRADRAWKRGNRHVQICDEGNICCRGLATLDASWLKGVRDDPERLFKQNLAGWRKQSARHRVAEIRLPHSAAAPSPIGFLKCIARPELWRRWSRRLRWSPVRRAWETGHALLRRGIETPRPILLIERPTAGSGHDYILTEAVPGAVGAIEFLSNRWPALLPTERRAWLDIHLSRFAREVRQLHDSGFDHRDLKFANLLVSGEVGDPRVWILDLDGVRVWRRLPAARAVQNLARIQVSAEVSGAFSRTDRLRFLRDYLGDKFGRDWKSWWRRIARVAEVKIEGNRRRRRPLS